MNFLWNFLITISSIVLGYFCYCCNYVIDMKKCHSQGAWANFQHLSYLTMRLRSPVSQSRILKQNTFILQLQRYLFYGCVRQSNERLGTKHVFSTTVRGVLNMYPLLLG